jgi:hypothetical protein
MFKMPTAVTALFVAGMGLALTITLAARGFNGGNGFAHAAA